MFWDSDALREVFARTRVLRRPTYGIVSGYHELPYICLGESAEAGFASTEVRGRIQVSPQFIVKPSHLESRYADIFGEDNVDAELSGRVFGFMGFPRRPVECKSEYIEVQHHEAEVQAILDRILDRLERMEDITTGLVITPDTRYYHVSVERFIASVLEDEFSV